jgi:hypothetical protein
MTFKTRTVCGRLRPIGGTFRFTFEEIARFLGDGPHGAYDWQRGREMAKALSRPAVLTNEIYEWIAETVHQRYRQQDPH